MQGMRALLRNSLGRSLRTLPEEDRLAAALPVVCGSALAAHCTVVALDDDRTLHLRVSSEDWLGSLVGMRDVLQRDLAQTAGVPLRGLNLQVARPAVSRPAASLGEAARAATAIHKTSLRIRKGSTSERR